MSKSNKPHSHHQTRKIDVVFLSPPWGGPSYLAGSDDDISGLTHSSSSSSQTTPIPPSSSEEHPTYSLSSILPIHGAQLFSLTRRITRNIAFYLPRNTRVDEISALLSGGKNTHTHTHTQEEEEHHHQNGETVATAEEQIEVEEEWMGNKLKALTCYFGGLVTGQEWL